MKAKPNDMLQPADRQRFRRRSSNSSNKTSRRNQKSNSVSSSTSSGTRYFDASSSFDNELATIEIDYSVNEDGEFKLQAPTNTNGKQRVYSVDFLLLLRDSTLIEPFVNVPDNEFWRKYLRNKRRSDSHNHSNNNVNNNVSNSINANGADSHESTGEMGSFAIKPIKTEGLNKFKKNNRHDKKSGFFGDIDDDDEAPAWLDDENDPLDPMSQSLNDVGKTVEDFEKWKLRMKLQEKKNNGLITSEEELQLDAIINNKDYVLPGNKSGNGVDSFFAFGPSSYDNTKNGLLNTTLEDTNEHDEAFAGSSSRFSSFFKPPSTDNRGSARESTLSVGPPSVDAAAGSRILSILGKSSEPSASPEKDIQPKEKSNTNDTFFMSLLKKSSQQPSPAEPPRQLANQQQPQHVATPSQQQEGLSNLMALFNKASQEQQQQRQLHPPGLPPQQQQYQSPVQQRPMQSISPLVHGQPLPPNLPQQKPGSQPQQGPPQGLPQGFPPGFPPINHMQQFPMRQYGPLPPQFQQPQQIPPQFRNQQLPPWLMNGNNLPQGTQGKEKTDSSNNNNNAALNNGQFIGNSRGPMPPMPPGFGMAGPPMYNPLPPNLVGNVPPPPHLQQGPLPPNMPSHIYGPPRQA